MSLSTWIIVALLALNTLAVVVMLISAPLQPSGARSTRVMYAFVFLVCPVVGVAAFGCARLLEILFREQKLDESNLTFDQSRIKVLLPPDEGTEMNYVPIMDALVTQDTSSLRRLLLDLLKNRSVISAHSVSVAVGSDDAETSHYAASAITDFLSEFRSGTQQYLFRVKQSPRDVQINIRALEYLHQTLTMHVMDDIEQRAYVYTTDGVAENMFANSKWYMTSEHYLWMTDLFLEIGDFDAAYKWVSRAEECRPEELDTYKCALHYYFRIKDQAAFFQKLDTLKASNLWIDKEILDLIRMLNEPRKA